MNTMHDSHSVLDALAGMAGRIVHSASQRRAERVIARLTTRHLEDMGYARDWDGSIYRSADRA